MVPIELRSKVCEQCIRDRARMAAVRRDERHEHGRTAQLVQRQRNAALIDQRSRLTYHFGRRAGLAHVDLDVPTKERLFADDGVAELKAPGVDLFLPDSGGASSAPKTGVDIIDFAYHPRELRITAGAAVTFVNRDGESGTRDDASRASRCVDELFNVRNSRPRLIRSILAGRTRSGVLVVSMSACRHNVQMRS
jgi:hypothetical protein